MCVSCVQICVCSAGCKKRLLYDMCHICTTSYNISYLQYTCMLHAAYAPHLHCGDILLSGSKSIVLLML